MVRLISWYDITDDWNEIASIDYNVMHVDIVNTIRIMNYSGLRIYDTGSKVYTLEHLENGMIKYANQ